MAAGRHEVEWTAPAVRDLEAIVAYFAADRPEAAAGVYWRLRGLGDGLAERPWRGRVVPELRELGATQFRELVSPPWRLVYRVSGRRVAILLLFDGRRDCRDLLVDRSLDAT